jgi:hypothetical protein
LSSVAAAVLGCYNPAIGCADVAEWQTQRT